MAEGNPVQFFWDQFLFPRIFRTFRMAIHPRKMTIAFMAVAAIGLLGWIMDFNRLETRGQSSRSNLDFYMAGESRLGGPMGYYRPVPGGSRGLFAELYRFGSGHFHEALYDLSRMDIPEVVRHVRACLLVLEQSFLNYPLWSSLFFTLTLMILAVAGGAICRIAALQFAQGERPGLVQSLEFSAHRFSHFFLAPLAPLMLIGVTGLFVALLALAGNIPWVGELMVGLGMPLVLILGMIMMALAIGSIAGFSLVFPAVAYDDSDCFIAVNNSFRYAFARPWRYGFYTLLATAYGGITYYFVRLFGFGVLWMSYRFMQLGFIHDNLKLNALWQEPSIANFFGQPIVPGGEPLGTMALGRFLIHGAVLAIVVLIIAFFISFFFTANTIIYALLRKGVDDIPLDHVHTREEDLKDRCGSVPPNTNGGPSSDTPSSSISDLPA
jgi:hypothetical protein